MINHFFCINDFFLSSLAQNESVISALLTKHNVEQILELIIHIVIE